MKKVKILPLVLLLPIIAACLFSCNNTLPEETAEITTEETTARPAETCFRIDFSPYADFTPGEILIAAKDPNANYTVEDFPEIDCESIKFSSRNEEYSFWKITIKAKYKQNTIDAIKELAYRSDLYFAEPNFLLSPD